MLFVGLHVVRACYSVYSKLYTNVLRLTGGMCVGEQSNESDTQKTAVPHVGIVLHGNINSICWLFYIDTCNPIQGFCLAAQSFFLATTENPH